MEEQKTPKCQSFVSSKIICSALEAALCSDPGPSVVVSLFSPVCSLVFPVVRTVVFCVRGFLFLSLCAVSLLIEIIGNGVSSVGNVST